MPKWGEHHEEHQKAMKITPQVWTSKRDIPGWATLNKETKIAIDREFDTNMNLVNQYAITNSGDAVYYLRNLNGDREVLYSYGYIAKKYLGHGKDGETIFGGSFLNPDKTYVVKTISNYAKSYILLQLILHRICQQSDKPGALTTFKIDEVNFNYMFYKADKPFTTIPNIGKDWHGALSEVCYLNQWLLQKHGILLWDLGFANGKNYMLDDNGKMRWVDYGGAGLVKTKDFDISLKPKGDKWVHYERMLENTKDNKQLLVDANNDFIRVAFFLHLQHVIDDHLQKPTDNINVWMSTAQLNQSVTHEIYNDILPNKLQEPWVKEMFELFKSHDFTDSTTWKAMGKYIENHVNT